MNGGKTDILVREVKIWFYGANPNAGVAPPQDTSISPNASVLLKAGTATEIKVAWLDDFGWDHLEVAGVPMAFAGHPAVEFRVIVEICWIDVNARLRRSKVKAGKVSRDLNKFLSWSPHTNRQALHKTIFSREQ